MVSGQLVLSCGRVCNSSYKYQIIYTWWYIVISYSCFNHICKQLYRLGYVIFLLFFELFNFYYLSIFDITLSTYNDPLIIIKQTLDSFTFKMVVTIIGDFLLNLRFCDPRSNLCSTNHHII